MFWNKTNSKKIEDLAIEMQSIKLQVTTLKLDLELYAKKLKASKGLKSVQEELGAETEVDKKDLYGGMFLTEDGKSNSAFRSTSRR